MSTVSTVKDEWVGIAFDRAWYIGQFEVYSEEDELSKIHFVEKSSLGKNNSFVWPELSGKDSDFSWVEQGLI